jgi:hypothetical protein
LSTIFSQKVLYDLRDDLIADSLVYLLALFFTKFSVITILEKFKNNKKE